MNSINCSGFPKLLRHSWKKYLEKNIRIVDEFGRITNIKIEHRLFLGCRLIIRIMIFYVNTDCCWYYNFFNSLGLLIYNCPECAYRFEDRDSLQEHLDDHRQRPHICDICGASLKRKEHLDRHKQGHNKDRPYQCSMCCKAFKRNEHLARHMIIHSGSKNQICTECGKAFYRKDHLKKHLQSHNGTRKSLGSSQSMQSGQNSEEQEQLNASYPMIMRPSGAPPFSILRT